MSFLSVVRRILQTEDAGIDSAQTLPGLDSDYLFRRFSVPRDADAVCRFQRETYELNFPGFVVDQAFLVGFRYDLKRAASDPNHGLFVIERHSEPIAFLWIVIHENGWTGERCGYINNVYVAPSARGKGLAKFLMAQAEEYFRSIDVRKVRLEVTEANECAVGLYRSVGYQVTRFVMEKEIEGPQSGEESGFA